MGERTREALILYNIALVKRDQSKFTEAFNYIESSLKILEELRTKIASQELRTSYFSTLRAAQLKILQQEKWISPYYWAAFTLQGDRGNCT